MFEINNNKWLTTSKPISISQYICNKTTGNNMKMKFVGSTVFLSERFNFQA